MTKTPRCGYRLLAAVLAASTSAPALAGEAGILQDALGNPEGLTVSASIRGRVEAIDGQFRPGKNDEDIFVSFRSILAAEYDAGQVRFGGQLRDARGYAQNAGTSVGKSDVNALEPLEFYGAIDLENVAAEGDVLSIVGGRTTLNIGSGRIIGRPGFSNSINSFTGGQLRWAAPNGDRLIAIYVMPSDRQPSDFESIRDNEVEFDAVDDDKQLFGAHFTRGDLFAGISGEVYAFGYDEEAAGSDQELLTYGARLVRGGAPGLFDIDMEAIHQVGDINYDAAPDIDVDAFFAHAEVGYSFAAPAKPRLFLFADYGTGDDADTADYERFDYLFGKRRGDFGPTGLYGLLSRGNIASAGLGVTGKPFAGTDVELTGRGAWLDEATDSFAKTKVVDPAGESGTYAGTQIAARVRHWLVPDRYRLELGGVYFDKGRFLRTAPNAPQNGDTRYGYVALTASF